MIEELDDLPWIDKKDKYPPEPGLYHCKIDQGPFDIQKFEHPMYFDGMQFANDWMVTHWKDRRLV